MSAGISWKVELAGRLSAVDVDRFEFVTEDFLGPLALPLGVIDEARDRGPVSLHGLSLSIGSTDPLSWAYVEALRWLVERVRPEIVSDHLAWSTFGGEHAYDLLPLPMTEEALRHVAERVERVQDRIGQPLCLENPARLFAYPHDELTEGEFFAELAARTGCGMLLDVNNVAVTAHDLGLDPVAALDAYPASAVRELHLAGHRRTPTRWYDTHDRPVDDHVWGLYARAVDRLGPLPTVIEWDTRHPPIDAMVADAVRARAICARQALARSIARSTTSSSASHPGSSSDSPL
ncbi:MAG: DUF692 domain-containing protein [Myxococcota bacterium]